MKKLIESLIREIEEKKKKPRETVELKCDCPDDYHSGCITVIDGNY